MNLFLCIIALGLTFGAPPALRAQTNWDYAPLLDGRAWPRIPVVTYVEGKSNTWVHPSNPKIFPTVHERLEDEDADFTTVVLRFPDNRTFKTHNEFVLGPYLCAVYSGDFNQDGIPDFLAIKPSGVNGIGCWYFTGVFAFSEGDHYRFTRIGSWGLGPESLVIDPQTKSFRLIHTSLRQGMGTDGRVHSFWVHRFFKWNGGFEIDQKLAPVWIQFLDRPNHRPTKLLTTQQKAKIWAEDWRFQSEIER